MQSQENTIKAFLRTAVDLHQEHWDRDIGTSLMKINDLFETFLKSVTELGSALKGPTSHELVSVWGSLGRAGGTCLCCTGGMAGFCLCSKRAQEHITTPCPGDGIREPLGLVPLHGTSGLSPDKGPS